MSTANQNIYNFVVKALTGFHRIYSIETGLEIGYIENSGKRWIINIYGDKHFYSGTFTEIRKAAIRLGAEV